MLVNRFQFTRRRIINASEDICKVFFHILFFIPFCIRDMIVYIAGMIDRENINGAVFLAYVLTLLWLSFILYLFHHQYWYYNNYINNYELSVDTINFIDTIIENEKFIFKVSLFIVLVVFFIFTKLLIYYVDLNSESNTMLRFNQELNLLLNNKYDRAEADLEEFEIPKHIKSICFDKLEKHCPICLEDIDFDKSFITSCGHNFHLECIKKSASEDTKCPICRINKVFIASLKFCKNQVRPVLRSAIEIVLHR